MKNDVLDFNAQELQASNIFNCKSWPEIVLSLAVTGIDFTEATFYFLLYSLMFNTKNNLHMILLSELMHTNNLDSYFNNAKTLDFICRYIIRGEQFNLIGKNNTFIDVFDMYNEMIGGFTMLISCEEEMKRKNMLMQILCNKFPNLIYEFYLANTNYLWTFHEDLCIALLKLIKSKCDVRCKNKCMLYDVSFLNIIQTDYMSKMAFNTHMN